jgi:hypothetical protein
VNITNDFHNYEYSTRNETIRANSPVASARANPRIAYVNSCNCVITLSASSFRYCSDYTIYLLVVRVI